MLRVTLGLLLCTLAPPSLIAGEEPTKAARQYEALLEQFEEEGGARIFAPRFLELARENPDDPVSAKALLWVAKKVRGKSITDDALSLLAAQHIDNEVLGLGCSDIARSRSPQAETLLRKLFDDSPHKPVQAVAGVHLAGLLETEAGLVEQLKSAPELAPRVLQYYGKAYGKHLSSLEPAALEKKRESVYEQLLSGFGDVDVEGTTLGEFAQKRLFRIRHLSVGKQAPEIEGEDAAGKAFKLSQYRGKVVMLTFWGHW